MQDFTFCAFTYNQEDIVLQQLASIKYQIEKYGKDVHCDFLLADDHSTDQTVKVVENWLEDHSPLFNSINIVVSKSNRGIVRNFESALRNIKTNNFYIAAGDDFYYQNNIFEMDNDYNFIFSPVINIDNEGHILKNEYRFLKRLILCGEDNERIKTFVREQYQYEGGIEAAGVFFTKELVDEGLFNALSAYTWIEDAPLYYYLMGSKKTKIKIFKKPLVVYRRGFGISNKSDEDLDPRYLQDRMIKKYNIHRKQVTNPHWLCPHYYEKITKAIYNSSKGFLHHERIEKLVEYKKSIKNEWERANDYVQQILNASEFN